MAEGLSQNSNPRLGPSQSILQNLKVVNDPHKNILVQQPLAMAQPAHVDPQQQAVVIANQSKSNLQSQGQQAEVIGKVRMDDKCQARDTSEPGNLAACLEEAPSLNPNSENAQMKDGTEQGMASEPSSKSAITSHTRPGVLGVKPLALKRAASRKSSGHNTGPDSPDTPSQPLSASMSQRLLNKARVELTKAEMNLPWEHVHEYWAEKRPAWRKSVKQTESLISFLQVVKILRDAIKWPSNPDAQKELRSWDDHMQWCTSSNSTPEDVNSLLQSVKAFSRALKIEERLKPNVEDIGEDELIPSLPDEAMESLAMQAFHALLNASEGGDSAIAQCPVEAILQYNIHATVRLQQMLEAEITRWECRLQGAKEEAIPSGSLFSGGFPGQPDYPYSTILSRNGVFSYQS